MANKDKNVQTLLVKYRAWFKGIPPRPIRFQIPGWAGDSHGHSNGDKPQPWHCPPFVDGSTYGLEFVYPFDSEVRVRNVDGDAVFDCDFSGEPPPFGVSFPPFLQFAPGHYGFTSSLDIEAPPGYVIRIEPHPRFFTDHTGSVPVAVTGHIQSEWWPKIFFIVFKTPRPGETHVFRKGEPYAQLILVPRRINYDIQPMSEAEAARRQWRDSKISNYARHIAKNNWTDHKANPFDDKYKVLAGVFAKEGVDGVDRYLDAVLAGAVVEQKQRAEKSRRAMPRKLLKVKKK